VSSDPPRVVLRLHPNLHNGSTSPYMSHRLRADAELEVGTKLIKHLVRVCREIDISCLLCSALVKNKFILAMPNVTIISHHGSILNEARSLNVPVLCSCISYLMDEQDHENVLIWRKGLEEAVTLKVIRQLQDHNHVYLSSMRLWSAMVADRYNSSLFEVTLDRLNFLASQSGFSCFDKMVYSQCLSWDYNRLQTFIPEAVDIIEGYILLIRDFLKGTSKY